MKTITSTYFFLKVKEALLSILVFSLFGASNLQAQQHYFKIFERDNGSTSSTAIRHNSTQNAFYVIDTKPGVGNNFTTQFDNNGQANWSKQYKYLFNTSEFGGVVSLNSDIIKNSQLSTSSINQLRTTVYHDIDGDLDWVTTIEGNRIVQDASEYSFIAWEIDSNKISFFEIPYFLFPSSNYSYSTYDFVATPGSLQIASLGNGHIIIGLEDATNELFALAIDNSGNPSWLKKYTSSSLTFTPNELVSLSSGGYALVGNSSNNEIFVLECDNNGNINWVKTFAVPGCVENSANTLLETDNGGYIIGGNTTDNNFNEDLYALRLDGTGTVLWSVGINEEDSETILDVVLTNNGYAFAGNTGSKAFILNTGDCLPTSPVSDCQFDITTNATNISLSTSNSSLPNHSSVDTEASSCPRGSTCNKVSCGVTQSYPTTQVQESCSSNECDLSITATVDFPPCKEQNKGEIEATVSNGSGTYIYSMDGGESWQTNGLFSNLEDGLHHMIVEDLNTGCQLTISKELCTNQFEVFSPDIDIDVQAATSPLSPSGDNPCLEANGGFTFTSTTSYTYKVYDEDGNLVGEQTGIEVDFDNLFSGEYTIVVIDENGCEITIEKNICCNCADVYKGDDDDLDDLVPNCSVTADFDLQMFGNDVGLSDLSTANSVTTLQSYYWTFGDGTPTAANLYNSFPSSIVHNYTNPGTYNICLTVWGVDNTGTVCSDTKCQTIMIAGKKSNDESLSNASSIEVYPNPVQNYLSINLSASADVPIGQISLYDVNGQLRKEMKWNEEASHFDWDVSELPTGIYILSVKKSNQQTEHFKIIKH